MSGPFARSGRSFLSLGSALSSCSTFLYKGTVLHISDRMNWGRRRDELCIVAQDLPVAIQGTIYAHDRTRAAFP